MVGQTISHYKIIDKLGQGGMGEVYRATDTKLKREVAIKVLPEQFTQDPQRLARFEREAEVLASLDHPNIGQIYGIEDAGQTKALVLQLIEGPTLADKIAQGAIPVEEALKIALQIAEGLEAAHEKGVIHRDLKPANIKVNPEGQVKILDFGLAKALEAEAPDSSLSQSPTLTNAATQAGVILGTAAYMSPEQAKGKPVDKRADIFAFGAVLYEMLTGKMAFEGEDISDTLASILARDPDWEALPQDTPWRIKELLGDCLQKDSHDRPHDIAHARIQIRKALKEPTADSPIEVTSTVQPPLWRKAIPWSIAAVVTGALILVLLYFQAGTESSQVVHFSVLPPEETDFDSNAGPMALSPDGQLLAFVARTPEENRMLWVRPLDSGSAQLLPGTEDAFAPFWSPDSRSLGFFAAGKLKKIDASGGSLETLNSSVSLGFGGTWNQDGIILFSPARGAGIQRVSSTGKDGIPVTSPSESLNEFMHMWPSFLPDGNHFLYVARTSSSDKMDQVYVSSLDGINPTPLFTASSNVIYAAPGYLLFWREGTLRAQRFDAERLQIMGEALSVATGVRFDATTLSGLFSASQNGLLTYRAGSLQARLSQLVWFDRVGQKLDTVGEPDNYYFPRLSHNGRQVAVDVSDLQNNGDIWLYELSRPIASRFTFDPANDSLPMWSPDDSQIVFSSTRRNRLADLYQKPTGGTGNAEVLLSDEDLTAPSDWSRDGNFIAVNRGLVGVNSDLWVFSIQEQEFTPFVATPFRESDGRFSPDGKWMVYVSDESGQPEIYVQPFPGPGGKLRVSTSGGSMPSWSHDGRELFFIAPDKSLMRAGIKHGPELEIEVPQPLFVTQIKHKLDYPLQYDVSPDGQRFLINTLLEQEDATSITLILNWFEELKRLVPTD